MTDQHHQTIDDLALYAAQISLGRRVLKGLVRPHFVIAAAILLVTAAGWGFVVNRLKLFTEKLAVPWPAGRGGRRGFRHDRHAG